MTYAHMVRWILVVPSVLFSFYLCVLLALAIHIAAESFCPEHLIVSEICTADYMGQVKEALLLLAPALAATLMLGSAYICAPSHKWKLAAITFLLGSAAALYYAFDSGYWYTLALTEFTSAATLYFLYRHSRNEKAPL